MEGTLGLQIITTLVQTVPIWTFVGIAVKYWITRSEKTANEFKNDLDHRFNAIQSEIDDRSKDLSTAIHAIREALQNIQLNMASANLLAIQRDVEALKEAKVRTEMKTEAALKAIDMLKVR